MFALNVSWRQRAAASRPLRDWLEVPDHILLFVRDLFSKHTTSRHFGVFLRWEIWKILENIPQKGFKLLSKRSSLSLFWLLAITSSALPADSWRETKSECKRNTRRENYAEIYPQKKSNRTESPIGADKDKRRIVKTIRGRWNCQESGSFNRNTSSLIQRENNGLRRKPHCTFLMHQSSK